MFPKIMVPHNGWFNYKGKPYEQMDDLGGPSPIFGNTHKKNLWESKGGAFFVDLFFGFSRNSNLGLGKTGETKKRHTSCAVFFLKGMKGFWGGSRRSF